MIRSSGDDSVKAEAFSNTTKNAGLSIRHYVFWKTIYAFTAAAAWLVLMIIPSVR
jgi:hypothetical protein